VEIEADDGTTGVGISIGGEPACFIIENHLSRFVEGQDPRFLFIFFWFIHLLYVQTSIQECCHEASLTSFVIFVLKIDPFNDAYSLKNLPTEM